MRRGAKLALGLAAVAVLGFLVFKFGQVAFNAVGLLFRGDERVEDEPGAYATEEPREEVTYPPELLDDGAYDGPEETRAAESGMDGGEELPVDLTIEELIRQAEAEKTAGD